MSVEKELNIILLGETGSGKSLLINSLAKYFQFQSLNEALRSKDGAASLIYTEFCVTDANSTEHQLSSGENEDGNERSKVGESSTVHCKIYPFRLEDVTVRLIDTPGMGDTSGEGADQENVAHILSFINNLDELHGIAIVMKNTETKMTHRFTYCLKTLLTNLNKSAVDNIVFIFTFSHKFAPGPVKKVIQKFIAEQLNLPTFKLDQNRMFCFDNGCYEHLLARAQGVSFKGHLCADYSLDWTRCVKETKCFLSHVSRLKPHRVKESVSLNDARCFLEIIFPFLSNLLDNIEHNTQLLDQFENDFRAENENDQNDLCLTQIDLKIVPLDRPVTFCISAKCREVVSVGGEEKYHYLQQCCQGCRVSNAVRYWCNAIQWNGYCKVCQCHRGEHDRRFYGTVKVASNLLTDEMKMAASDKERMQRGIQLIERRKAQLTREREVIEGAEMRFAKFLQTQALAKPIDRKSTEVKVIAKYEKEIADMECVTVDDVYRLKDTLLNLPINGPKFKEVVEANQSGVSRYVAAKKTLKMIWCDFKIWSD